jgi:hypothetical protein
MEITNKEREILISALVDEITIPSIENDEITTSMLADSSGMGRTACKRFLDKKVELGEMTKRTVKIQNGKCSTAYRKK